MFMYKYIYIHIYIIYIMYIYIYYVYIYIYVHTCKLSDQPRFLQAPRGKNTLVKLGLVSVASSQVKRARPQVGAHGLDGNHIMLSLDDRWRILRWLWLLWVSNIFLIWLFIYIHIYIYILFSLQCDFRDFQGMFPPRVPGFQVYFGGAKSSDLWGCLKVLVSIPIGWG